MKITRSQLRRLIKEELGILNEQSIYSDVVAIKDDALVGTFSYERLKNKRFIPTPEGEKRGFENSDRIPDGTKITKTYEILPDGSKIVL